MGVDEGEVEVVVLYVQYDKLRRPSRSAIWASDSCEGNDGLDLDKPASVSVPRTALPSQCLGYYPLALDGLLRPMRPATTSHGHLSPRTALDRLGTALQPVAKRETARAASRHRCSS